MAAKIFTGTCEFINITLLHQAVGAFNILLQRGVNSFIPPMFFRWHCVCVTGQFYVFNILEVYCPYFFNSRHLRVDKPLIVTDRECEPSSILIK